MNQTWPFTASESPPGDVCWNCEEGGDFLVPKLGRCAAAKSIRSSPDSVQELLGKPAPERRQRHGKAGTRIHGKVADKVTLASVQDCAAS